MVNRTLGDVLLKDGCIVTSGTQTRFISVNCSNEVGVDLKVFLQGTYDASNIALNTNLRSLSTFPGTEPYSSLSYTVTDNPNASIDPLMVAAISPEALTLVDYVYVELRAGTDPLTATRAASKVGLLRKDGTIVNLDGSAFTMCVNPGNYFVVINHRNHLGVMSQNFVTIN